MKKPYAGIKATGMESMKARPSDGRSNHSGVNKPKHLRRKGRKGRRM